MDIKAQCRSIIESRGQAPGERRLNDLLATCWAWGLEQNPEAATSYGHPDYNHLWMDRSLDAISFRKAVMHEQLEALHSIEAAELDESSALNYRLFEKNLRDDIEGAGFPGEFLQITPLWGPHSSSANTINQMPRGSLKALEDVVARLRGLPAMLDQTIALMREGIKAGVTQPKVVMRGIPGQIEAQIGVDPASSSFMTPFADLSSELGAKGEALAAEAASVVGSQVFPALQAMHDFLVDEYIPGCIESTSRADCPDGEAWYAYAVKRFTTTDLTPTQIHEIGMSEVDRIRAEMSDVIASTEFAGSFDDFARFLREDERFYFDTADELLMTYRDICKRADPELARLFGTLPRLPYGVLPVPAYIEQNTTTAYYMRGSPRAGRPGYFYANTYDLKTRPSWEMEALSLHEAVPGHHLQIALGHELEELPEFRKHLMITAFTEGWGLYSESLGAEMGFYKDPYSKFGQLTYEMWRAIRLVVDTGLHALGWSRDRAIEFFKSNTAKSEHDIVVEVDRYISWPGQALAYKIGELKIKELRAFATAELGERFDIRAFHDELLREAALPLDILESRIKGWVAQVGGREEISVPD